MTRPVLSSSAEPSTLALSNRTQSARQYLPSRVFTSQLLISNNKAANNAQDDNAFLRSIRGVACRPLPLDVTICSVVVVGLICVRAFGCLCFLPVCSHSQRCRFCCHIHRLRLGSLGSFFVGSKKYIYRYIYIE